MSALEQMLQAAGEKRLLACQEYEEACDHSDDPRDWPKSPSSSPFCGCETCVTREVLTGAWPVVEDHVIRPLKDQARGNWLRGFIAGIAYAMAMTLLGFLIGFMAGWP